MATTMSAPVAVKASALIASARISFAFFASLMWPVVQQLIVDEVASPRMPPTVPMRKIEKTIVAADVQNTASFACFTRCVGCGGPRDTDVSIGARSEFACAWPIARPMTGVPVSIDARTGTAGAGTSVGTAIVTAAAVSGTVIWKVPPAATPAGIITVRLWPEGVTTVRVLPGIWPAGTETFRLTMVARCGLSTSQLLLEYSVPW